MDYIYSEISNQILNDFDYKGAISSTAVVTVNNKTKTIQVDVKPLAQSQLEDSGEDLPADSSYLLVIVMQEDGTSVGRWIKMDSLSQSIADVADDLSRFKIEVNEKIEKLQNQVTTELTAQIRSLQSDIDQAKQELRADIDAERQRAIEADNEIKAKIATLNNNLEIEMEARGEADSHNEEATQQVLSQLNKFQDDVEEKFKDYYTKEESDQVDYFENDPQLNIHNAYFNLKENYPLAGLSVKNILKLMLYGAHDPEFTQPSLTALLNSNYRGAMGTSIQIQGTASYDQGKILLQNVQQGVRAGKALSYKIGTQNSNISNSNTYNFNYTISSLLPGQNDVRITVNHAAGDQPYNNLGIKYGEPYPAGSLTTSVYVTGLTGGLSGLKGDTFTDAPEIILVDIDTATKNQKGLLIDASRNVVGYQMITTASASKYPIFLVPASVDVLGVRGFDTLANSFKWLGGSKEASMSNMEQIESVQITVDGVSIEYKQYIYQKKGGANAFQLIIDPSIN